jgi:2-polyprenyl-3-methyl-5-hydroxy-6-metoxy-1,4-benzoquinol methylase
MGTGDADEGGHGEAPSWDDLAGDWDSDPGPRAYAAAAFDSLADALATRAIPLRGTRVLDFGCGTGLLTERLATICAGIDATDASPAMLAVLRGKIARAGWGHVRALDDVGDAAGPYDLIVASSVCAFLDDYPGTVRALARLLGPRGVFIQWDWEREEDDPDAHGLTRGEISAALAAAGLEAVEVAGAFTIEIDGAAVEPLRGVGSAPPG